MALVAERNTPVRLSFEQGVLILEAGSSDDAQAVERVDAELEGDDISIAFNPTFLLDGLSAIDSPVAQLSLHDLHQARAAQRQAGRGRRGRRGVQVPDHAGAAVRLTPRRSGRPGRSVRPAAPTRRQPSCLAGRLPSRRP